MAAPIIEAADVTNSGNNTATTSWAVDYPAHSAGDLVVVHVASDANVTHNWPSTGPNGETIVDIVDSTGGTAQRASGFYWIASAGTASGTITVTPSATEQWTASVIVVPAGEFNASDPIQATVGTENDTTADTAITSPSWTSSTAGGRVVVFHAIDVVATTATPSGWTTLANVDRGAVAGVLAVRDAETTEGETIAAADWTASSETNSSFGYVINGPPLPVLADSSHTETIVTHEVVSRTRKAAALLILLAAGESVNLSVDGLAQTQALESPTLTQASTLTVQGLAQVQAIEAPALTQANTVAPAGLAQTQAIGAVVLEQGNQLAPAGIAQEQTLGAVALTQANTLAVQDADQEQTLGTVALGVGGELTVAGVAQVQAIEAPALTQANTLASAGLAQEQLLATADLILPLEAELLSTTDPSWTEVVHQITGRTRAAAHRLVLLAEGAPPIELTVQGLAQDHTLSTVALTQASTLTVQGLAQTQVIGNVTLTEIVEGYDLLVLPEVRFEAFGEGYPPFYGRQAGKYLLTLLRPIEYTLEVAGLAQTHAVGAVALTQAHTLSLAGVVQTQAIEAVVLEMPGVLSPAGIAQVQVIEAPALTQAGTLTAQGLAQEQTIEPVVVDFAVQITVQGLAQTQALGTVALTQANELAVQGIAQIQGLAPVDLFQGNSITPADLYQSQALAAAAAGIAGHRSIRVRGKPGSLFVLDRNGRIVVRKRPGRPRIT